MTPGPDVAAALLALPLFPLPEVVLLPGALLPLHIFEPRYRAMLADALATHRCIAMAYVLEPGAEPPRIARAAGLGVIVQHEALPDGRSNILLQGRARVALDELPMAGLYRRARARILQQVDTSVPDADLAMLHAAVTRFVTSVRKRAPSANFTLPAGVDAGGAADLCAHHLVMDAAARQRVLEELDVAARVRLVATELTEQTVRLPGSAPSSERLN